MYKPESEVPVITDVPAEPTPKLKFTKRTKVFAGVAVAAIAAGTVAIIKARSDNDSSEEAGDYADSDETSTTVDI